MPIRAEREPVLRRTLRALDDEMLAALARGLGRHSTRLVTGRLYRRDGGGCAVGVMLRELHPEAYSSGLRFWLRHAWRRRVGSYGGELRRNRRLRHLEWIFDGAVEQTRTLVPGLSTRRAAGAVGRWMRDEAIRELHWRELSSSLSPQGAEASARRSSAFAA